MVYLFVFCFQKICWCVFFCRAQFYFIFNSNNLEPEEKSQYSEKLFANLLSLIVFLNVETQQIGLVSGHVLLLV